MSYYSEDSRIYRFVLFMYRLALPVSLAALVMSLLSLAGVFKGRNCRSNSANKCDRASNHHVPKINSLSLFSLSANACKPAISGKQITLAGDFAGKVRVFSRVKVKISLLDGVSKLFLQQGNSAKMEVLLTEPCSTQFFGIHCLFVQWLQIKRLCGVCCQFIEYPVHYRFKVPVLML